MIIIMNYAQMKLPDTSLLLQHCQHPVFNKGKQTASTLLFQIDRDHTATVSCHYATNAPIVSPPLSPRVFVLIRTHCHW